MPEQYQIIPIKTFLKDLEKRVDPQYARQIEKAIDELAKNPYQGIKLTSIENGKPRLHMHAALGREGKTRSGCIRPGIEVWKLGEVIVLEITENTAHRRENAAGFSMLEP